MGRGIKADNWKGKCFLNCYPCSFLWKQVWYCWVFTFLDAALKCVLCILFTTNSFVVQLRSEWDILQSSVLREALEIWGEDDQEDLPTGSCGRRITRGGDHSTEKEKHQGREGEGEKKEIYPSIREKIRTSCRILGHWMYLYGADSGMMPSNSTHYTIRGA